MNEKLKGIIRLLVTLVLVFNSYLTAKGLNPIPFDENAFTEIATELFSGIAVLWSWWKNNNMTKESIAANKIMKDFKKNKGLSGLFDLYFIAKGKQNIMTNPPEDKQFTGNETTTKVYEEGDEEVD